MQLYLLRQRQRHHVDSDDSSSDTTLGEADDDDDDERSQGGDSNKNQDHLKREWRRRRQSVDFEAAVVRVTDNGGLLIEDANAADARRLADGDSESSELPRRKYRQWKREARIPNGDHCSASSQRRNGAYVKRSESTSSSSKPNVVSNRGVTGADWHLSYCCFRFFFSMPLTHIFRDDCIL